jgi:protoheme IX farnesyltransferase
MKLLIELAALVKIRIVLLSTLSAVTGFILVSDGFQLNLALFIIGLFSLAAGSAALNQYQERHLDRLMDRTKHRPLAAGQLTPKTGLTISLVLIAIGLLVLISGFGVLAFLMGVFTVIFYNGIYTYLKRVTAFAAGPGALIGALPPAIGWAAGGGAIASPTLLGLMLFFYLWQVPHFWLLLGTHSRDYVKAGFPSLSNVFTTCQLGRITFTWVLATACAVMLFPLLGMFNHSISLVFLVAVTIWLGLHALPLVKRQLSLSIEPVFRRAFRDINIFALLIMVILIIDHGI